MQVRDLKYWDWPQIEHWHRQSEFGYPLPVPPNFVELPDKSGFLPGEAFAAMKLVSDGERPVGAALARMTVEIYGFSDPEWGTPAMRLEMLRVLHQAIAAEMKKQRIRTAHAWLPPQIAKSFGRRLKKLFRWNEPAADWRCLVKDIF
jgi:hypothetical protein